MALIAAAKETRRFWPAPDLYKRLDLLCSQTLCYMYSGMIHEYSDMRRSRSVQDEGDIHLCLEKQNDEFVKKLLHCMCETLKFTTIKN